MADFVEKTGKTVDEAIEAALFALHLPRERCTVEVLDEPSKGFFGFGKRDARVRVTAKEEPAPQPASPSEEPEAVQQVVQEEELSEEKPAVSSADASDAREDSSSENASAPLRETSPRRNDAIVDRGFSYSSSSREDRPFSEQRRERFSSGRRSYASDSSGAYSRTERPRPSMSAADAAVPLQKAEDFLRQIFRAMELDVAIERRERPHSFELNLSGHNLGILIGKHGQTLDALQYLVNLAANQGLTEERVRIILDIEGYRERREETLYRLAARLADRCCRTNQRVVLEPMNRHERKIIHLALQENHRVLTYSAGDEPFRKVVIEPKHRVSRMDGYMSEEDY